MIRNIFKIQDRVTQIHFFLGKIMETVKEKETFDIENLKFNPKNPSHRLAGLARLDVQTCIVSKICLVHK